VVLSCRSSNTPRWYNGTDLISSISSDPVYQTSVNRSTKFLRIRAYTNSDKGQYTCRDTVNSIQLERSISLTTGECVAVDVRHLVKIPNYIFVQKVTWLIFRTHLQIIVYWTPSFEYHQLSYCRNFVYTSHSLELGNTALMFHLGYSHYTPAEFSVSVYIVFAGDFLFCFQSITSILT